MSLLAVAKVANRLQPILDELVIVGGCAAALLMPPTVTARPTDDVDCVSLINTYAEFSVFEMKLRNLGCSECREEGTPICRWIVDGIRTDFMPTEGRVLGFCNRWYGEVIKEPVLVELSGGLKIKVVNIPVFFATKFEAFADRGGGVHYGSSDIEDIIALLAYRQDAVDLIAKAPLEIRLYLGEEARGLLALTDIEDIVSGCFDGDKESQALVPIVMNALREIALLQRSH